MRFKTNILLIAFLLLSVCVAGQVQAAVLEFQESEFILHKAPADRALDADTNNVYEGDNGFPENANTKTVGVDTSIDTDTGKFTMNAANGQEDYLVEGNLINEIKNADFSCGSNVDIEEDGLNESVSITQGATTINQVQVKQSLGIRVFKDSNGDNCCEVLFKWETDNIANDEDKLGSEGEALSLICADATSPPVFGPQPNPQPNPNPDEEDFDPNRIGVIIKPLKGFDDFRKQSFNLRFRGEDPNPNSSPPSQATFFSYVIDEIVSPDKEAINIGFGIETRDRPGRRKVTLIPDNQNFNFIRTPNGKLYAISFKKNPSIVFNIRETEVFITMTADIIDMDIANNVQNLKARKQAPGKVGTIKFNRLPLEFPDDSGTSLIRISPTQKTLEKFDNKEVGGFTFDQFSLKPSDTNPNNPNSDPIDQDPFGVYAVTNIENNPLSKFEGISININFFVDKFLSNNDKLFVVRAFDDDKNTFKVFEDVNNDGFIPDDETVTHKLKFKKGNGLGFMEAALEETDLFFTMSADILDSNNDVVGTVDFIDFPYSSGVRVRDDISDVLPFIEIIASNEVEQKAINSELGGFFSDTFTFRPNNVVFDFPNTPPLSIDSDSVIAEGIDSDTSVFGNNLEEIVFGFNYEVDDKGKKIKFSTDTSDPDAFFNLFTVGRDLDLSFGALSNDELKVYDLVFKQSRKLGKDAIARKDFNDGFTIASYDMVADIIDPGVALTATNERIKFMKQRGQTPGKVGTMIFHNIETDLSSSVDQPIGGDLVFTATAKGRDNGFVNFRIPAGEPIDAGLQLLKDNAKEDLDGSGAIDIAEEKVDRDFVRVTGSQVELFDNNGVRTDLFNINFVNPGHFFSNTLDQSGFSKNSGSGKISIATLTNCEEVNRFDEDNEEIVGTKLPDLDPHLGTFVPINPQTGLGFKPLPGDKLAPQGQIFAQSFAVVLFKDETTIEDHQFRARLEMDLTVAASKPLEGNGKGGFIAPECNLIPGSAVGRERAKLLQDTDQVFGTLQGSVLLDGIFNYDCGLFNEEKADCGLARE